MKHAPLARSVGLLVAAVAAATALALACSVGAWAAPPDAAPSAPAVPAPGGAPAAAPATSPAAELEAVLAQLREARAAWYARQRARAAEIDRARAPVRRLESEIAELTARAAEADQELAAVRAESAALQRDESAGAAALAAAAPELDRAVSEAAAFLIGRIPYRIEDRTQRLAGASAAPAASASAAAPRSPADRFVRYWAHLQEELRIARSGETYTAEVPLDGGRAKPARLFRVGHLALGYLTEDGRDAGLFRSGALTPARSPAEVERIRAAIEMLDRRRAPGLLSLPLTAEGGK